MHMYIASGDQWQVQHFAAAFTQVVPGAVVI